MRFSVEIKFKDYNRSERVLGQLFSSAVPEIRVVPVSSPAQRNDRQHGGTPPLSTRRGKWGDCQHPIFSEEGLLSSGTSVSGENKCLVKGLSGEGWGDDNFLCRNYHPDVGEEKGAAYNKQKRETKWKGRKHINQKIYINSLSDMWWCSKEAAVKYKRSHPVNHQWLFLFSQNSLMPLGIQLLWQSHSPSLLSPGV